MPKNKSERELEHLQEQVGYHDGELRVFLADVIPSECCKRENMEDRMLELENLVTTFGGVVILEHIQKRGVPDYTTYIGPGKLDEIIHEMEMQHANLLVFGNILKPHQMYEVNARLKNIGAKAWDRVDLILKIFERHAKSTEAKLQIELAAIKHMGPRIFGMGMELSRQGGGSKLARGKGETNTEIMKRHLRKREDTIKKDLEKYSHVRAEHRKSRARKGLMTIGIVGYTNAGKSSLLNALTQKGVLSEDKLFATLGTSVGKMWIESPVNSEQGRVNSDSCHPELDSGSLNNQESYLESGKENQKNYKFTSSEEGQDWKYTSGTEVLLSDTIGFIRDLPPELIDAFSSTLEDSIESDVLFHVVDASDPKIDEKVQVVENILEKIGATQPRMYVFNKRDCISPEQLQGLKVAFQDLHPVFVSSYSKEGFDELKARVLKELSL